MRITRRRFVGACAAWAAVTAFAGARAARGATAKVALPSVDLGFIADRMKLLRRPEWTSETPRTLQLREAGEYDRLTVHHTGYAVNVDTVKNAVIHDIRGVFSTHRSRKYGDIGYHLLVDYAGRVWEGRSLAYEGAHVADENERNIGIALLGDFEQQEPSAEQLDSMRLLVSLLLERYEIAKQKTYGHRDLGPTACPGRNLYPHVARLKAE